MNKKIFITGGAGFIGSAIIKKFQEQGHELMVYDNLSFGSRQFIEIPDSHFIQGDILDKGFLHSSLQNFQPQYILHLAAVHFIPYCNEHPFESANINIKGSMHLIDCAKKLTHLEKLFFASTAAVYPIYDEAINENIDPAPSDIYGLSKLTGEAIFQKFHLETGLPTIICRFFNAFGPNETNPHLIPAIQGQLKGGNRKIKLGNTLPKRDFIHTYDMADAVDILLKKFQKGIDVFNLGRGIEYAVTEVAEAFEKALGEQLEIEIDPTKVRKTDRLHLLADILKLKTFTGWQPKISLEQGIKTLLA